ncbi:Transmembrane protein [Entamoeba marina]
MDTTINSDSEYYPCCLTWTSIPVISWFFPFIGHTSITDMNGIHHDYSFPYIIHSGKQTILGRVFKYIPLKLGKDVTKEDFERAISKANKKWKHTMHKYIIHNCHDYCVDILNDIKYKEKTNWNDVTIVLELIAHSQYVNKSRAFATFIPTILLWLFVCLCIVGLVIVILYQEHVF